MRTLPLALLLLCCCAPAAAESFRIFSETRLTDDSDQQSQSNISVGYRQVQPQMGTDASWSMSLGHRHLSSPIGSESFDFLRLAGRGELASDAGASASLDISQGASWSPALGTVAVHWLPTPKWRFEGSAERGIVDTVIAVRERTRLDTYATSADLVITPTVTAVVGLSSSRFSDGNDRLVRVARLAWSPARCDGLSMQLRGRRADSDAVGVGYFNPRRLEEYEAQVRLAGSPLGDQWSLSLMAGVGQQRVDGERPGGLFSIEARARGWFSPNYGLETRAGCGNVGTLSTASESKGYRSCELDLTLFASF